MAHPSGTMGTAVGDSKPGIRPSRLQNRIKNQGHQERRKALAVVADNFVALAFDEAVGTFKDVLQGAGLVHRKLERTRKKQRTRNRNTRSSMATELVSALAGIAAQ